MTPPSSNSKPPSSFFKFIRPPFNCQLALPESFTKHLEGGKKNKKTIILKRGSLNWPVEVLDGWVLAGEGFERFVRENGVKEFDFIVFKHEEKMVFDTIVYNYHTGCQREYPTNQEEKACHEAKLSDKCKSDTADKSMEKNIIRTNRPSFFGTLKSTNSKYTLSFPMKFVVANGINVGEMILKNAANEGLWKVKSINYYDRFFYVRWNEFRIANGFDLGDSFRFELIENGETPVAIISRVSEETRKGKAVM